MPNFSPALYASDISDNLVFGSLSDADFQLVILIQKEIKLGDKHSFLALFSATFLFAIAIGIYE